MLSSYIIIKLWMGKVWEGSNHSPSEGTHEPLHQGTDVSGHSKKTRH